MGCVFMPGGTSCECLLYRVAADSWIKFRKTCPSSPFFVWGSHFLKEPRLVSLNSCYACRHSILFYTTMHGNDVSFDQTVLEFDTWIVTVCAID